MKKTKNNIINNKSWKILLPFAAVIFLLNLSFEWAEFRGFLQIKEVNIVENSMFNNDYLADIYADSSKSIVSINVKEITDQVEQFKREYKELWNSIKLNKLTEYDDNGKTP